MDQVTLPVKKSFILSLSIPEMQEVFSKSQDDILQILLQSDINSDDIKKYLTNYDRRMTLVQPNELDQCLERLLFSIRCFSSSGLQEHIQPILSRLGLLLICIDLNKDKVIDALVGCFESLCQSVSAQFICELERININRLYNALQSKESKLLNEVLKAKVNYEENPIERLQLQYSLVQIVKKDNKEQAFELLEQLFLQSREIILENQVKLEQQNQSEIQKLIKELEAAKKFEKINTKLNDQISQLKSKYKKDKKELTSENANLKKLLNSQIKLKQKYEVQLKIVQNRDYIRRYQPYSTLYRSKWESSTNTSISQESHDEGLSERSLLDNMTPPSTIEKEIIEKRCQKALQKFNSSQNQIGKDFLLIV